MYRKRLLLLLLAAALMTNLTGCGSSAGTAKPAETTAASEEETTEAASEEETTEAAKETSKAPAATEQTPESASETESEAPSEPAVFSDPSAFEGFDTISYYNSTKGEMKVTFGVTKFGELNITDIENIMQYPDDVNERMIDPEKLGPGAFGLVITSWQTKSGASQCYMICNPAEEPAAPEDCVLTGVKDAEGLQFSNGIRYESSPDEIRAILGEPNEIIKHSQSTFTYCWRDETGEHELTQTLYEPETVGEVDGMSYSNFTIAGK